MNPVALSPLNDSWPRALFVRCTEIDANTWTDWGGTSVVQGLWSFPIADDESLIELLEHLSGSVHGWGRADMFVALTAPAGSKAFYVSNLLPEFQSLPVFLARRRHPWLLEDLAQHVRIYLQPIVDLQRGAAVFSYEALCRGIAPDNALLTGQEMFALASRARCLEALDIACQIGALHAKAKYLPGKMPLFINILPRSLIALDMEKEPWCNLAGFGIRPEEIVFEIVESEQTKNMDALVEAIERLRKRGFRIALDDLGSGYNGLTVLATLRPDFIKLDRELVQGVQSSQVRLALLQALISMAQRLGCATVAEGLERLEDITVCRDLGIHYGQGYYFSLPSPEPVIPPALPPRPEVPWYSRHSVKLRDFIELIPALPLEARIEEAKRYFQERRHQPFLIILDGRKPVGYVTRRGLSTAAQGARGLGRCCKFLNKRLPDQMSARSLAYRLCHDTDPHQPWVVVDDEGDYLGILEPWSVLGQLLTGHPTEGLNPLSHLPTGPVLRDTLDLYLRDGKMVTLVYIDLDHFKAFNDRYGFVRGDAMIMLLAELLRETFRRRSEAYLGHIGGDDFIVVIPNHDSGVLDILKRLLASFRGLAGYLYDKDDLDRGFFATEDGKPHPVAAISVVLIPGQNSPVANSLAASERVAKLKKLAKAQMGSVIAIDGEPPGFLTVATAAPREYPWEERAIRALSDIASHPRAHSQYDLDESFRRYPFFELIYELDAAGVQRFPNWVHPEMRGRLKSGGVGIDRSAQPYFVLARHNRKPYVSNLYLSSASSEFCATVALPLDDGAGNLDGVLVADLNLVGLVALTASAHQDADQSQGPTAPTPAIPLPPPPNR